MTRQWRPATKIYRRVRAYRIGLLKAGYISPLPLENFCHFSSHFNPKKKNLFKFQRFHSHLEVHRVQFLPTVASTSQPSRCLLSSKSSSLSSPYPSVVVSPHLHSDPRKHSNISPAFAVSNTTFITTPSVIVTAPTTIATGSSGNQTVNSTLLVTPTPTAGSTSTPSAVHANAGGSNADFLNAAVVGIVAMGAAFVSL